MSVEVISSEIPDLNGFIKELNLFDKDLNNAVRKGIHNGGSIIEAEQKRLAPEKTKDAISKGKIYITKKGIIGIKVGYQSSAFKVNSNGDNLGIIGVTYEFGRPGQSPQRSKPTMKQIRNGKEVIVNKGTIQPQPHIRRGYDNKINQACDTIFNSINNEIEKLCKG